MAKSFGIANRLREVLLDGYWIANTNYKAQIQSVNWEQATQKLGNLNTIAALTYHINYYLQGILDAFETGKLGIRDELSFDMPPIHSEADWERLVAAFIDHSEKFVAAVEQMEDNMFEQIFFEEKYGTYHRNIDGVIEHSYYHLGQISLIKKLITT